MSAIAITSPGDAREAQPQPLAGLVFALRFRPDGSSEQLDVEKPSAPDGGWLWLHFNLADMRACQYLATTPELPQPPRALPVAADQHQHLHPRAPCLYD